MNPPSLSIAVCPQSATGGVTLVVVGSADGVTPWLTSGAQEVTLGAAANLGPVYGVSCDSQGNVYAAEQAGLYVGKATVTGNNGVPGITGFGPVASGFAGLTPPLYGVFAGATNETPDGGAGGGGDGGCPGCTEAVPIPDDIDGGPLAFCNSIAGQFPVVSFSYVARATGDGGSVCCGKYPDTGSSDFGGCWMGTTPDMANQLDNFIGNRYFACLTICVDYNLREVANYYVQLSEPCSSMGGPGGPTPACSNMSPTFPGTGWNCSTAPPGYVVEPDDGGLPNCGYADIYMGRQGVPNTPNTGWPAQ